MTRRCLVGKPAAALAVLALAGSGLLAVSANVASASGWWRKRGHVTAMPAPAADVGGTWYWMRSPDQEHRIIASHYNRYCIRCHGADGRGVWDIPDVPDLSSAKWQATRSDDHLVRGILEGRGACMPAFRGTLTLEESWAMARYLRTFVPGAEASRPAIA